MSVEGTYNLEVSTPIGKKKVKFVFTPEGESMRGSVIHESYTLIITDGKVNGDQFEFVSEGKGPMGLSKVEAKGMVSSDDISGEMKIMPMSVKTKFKGTREV